MTPEEKFNQDVWWILREIRNDEFLTRKGEKVEFRVRVQPKTPSKAKQASVLDFPSEDTQKKLLHKLQERQAITDVEPVDNILRGSDIFNPTIYQLSINQKKFTEIYRKYENSIGFQQNKSEAPVVVLKNSPLIKPKTLELIAQEIGNLGTANNLIDFLNDCGVDKKLVEYPQTKWRMVNAILQTLATSPIPKDQETLFKIIEEASHPLMHNGDEELAKKYEDKFSRLLKYDGFALRNYKIKKITEEAKKDGDLDLYLKKKILVESWRDDLPHPISELSFNNNTIEQICYSLWDIFVSEIIFFGANTFPEDILVETDPSFHQEIAFNWNLIRDLDNNPHKVESGYEFDIEILDRDRLKKDVDEEINEFVSNKVGKEKIDGAKDFYPDTRFLETPSYLRGISDNYYAYKKQREVLLNFIAGLYERFENEILVIKFVEVIDKNVNVLRTLLALEAEGIFTINELRNDKKEWTDKDSVYAKIQLVKSKIPTIKKFSPIAEKQKPEIKKWADNEPLQQTKEPLHIVIDEVKKDIGIIRGLEEKAPPKIKGVTVAIQIKDARLDKQNYFLEVNRGEKIIYFKSKKRGEGLERETKQFKVLYHLWDFRWKLKDGRVLKKGELTSLDNLMRGSGSESTEAAYKHIQRLNNRFKGEGVAIEIAGENKKYRLIINIA